MKHEAVDCRIQVQRSAGDPAAGEAEFPLARCSPSRHRRVRFQLAPRPTAPGAPGNTAGLPAGLSSPFGRGAHVRAPSLHASLRLLAEVRHPAFVLRQGPGRDPTARLGRPSAGTGLVSNLFGLAGTPLPRRRRVLILHGQGLDPSSARCDRGRRYLLGNLFLAFAFSHVVE